MSAGEGSEGTIDSISSRDVEECLRLLDEVWPGTDDEAAVIPRQLGRFSIVRELGRGGFGVVFLAEDPLLERRVALKVPRVEVLSQSQGWRRFLREARTASRLDHPNLVPLLEAGAIGPVGYIVSAYVEGPTLEQCLREARGGAPARFSARLVATLAGAIEHVHERGILHRDLKPANILMQAPEFGGDHPARQPWDEGRAQEWVPRICDFGLAKLCEIDGDETRTRLAAGSPSYMSPEQAEARHDDIGPATDIYGLGATLYQLLTGRPPFAGASELETLRRVVADEPARPRQLRPGLPRDIETICLKCLAKRPEQRYGSAAALAGDLERLLEGRPIVARPVPIWERGWKWARRHPALAMMATATSLAVLAGLGGLIWHGSVLHEVNQQLSGANEQLRGVNGQLRVAVEEKETNAALLTRQLAGHQIFAAQQAVAAKNFELAHRQLAAAEGELGTAGFACSYLRRSFRDRLRLLAGHGAAVDCLAAAPDGRALASSDGNGEIRVWDLKTGQSLTLASRSDRPMQRLVFSPDSRTLASAESYTGSLHLWDVGSGRWRGHLQYSGAAAVTSLFFTPDGLHLAAVRHGPDPAGKVYNWWDVSSVSDAVSKPGWPVFPITAPDDPVRRAFTPVDERLRLLADAIDGRPVGALSELERSWIHHPPRGVSVTRDRRLVVVGLGDGSFTVQRFSTDCWTLMIGCIQSCGTSIVLIDPTKWHDSHDPIERERERLERLATLLVPATLRQRKDSDPVVLTRIGEPVAYSNDGRMLATWREEEDELKIIDLATGQHAQAFDQGDINNVTSMCFTPDGGTLAIGGGDHMVRLWRVRAEPQPVTLPGHAPREAWALAFASDGHTLASGGDDGQVRLWDTATGREKAALTGHHSLVTSLAVSPDCRMLASGSFDGSRPLVIWDVKRETRLVEPAAPSRKVFAVALSPDGLVLAAGGEDMMVRLWDARNGRLVRTIGAHSNGIFSLAFSPDGRTLASGGVDHRIALTEVSTGKSRTIKAPDQCCALAFFPDGSRLHSAHHGGSIVIWDVARRQQITSLPGHNGHVRALAVSPDGTSLASGGDDRTVRVWDTVTSQELLCLTDCKARVNAVAFSPDGNTLAAADHSGAITIWRADRAPK